jgi:hypothetical protein
MTLHHMQRAVIRAHERDDFRGWLAAGQALLRSFPPPRSTSQQDRVEPIPEELPCSVGPHGIAPGQGMQLSMFPALSSP